MLEDKSSHRKEMVIQSQYGVGARPATEFNNPKQVAQLGLDLGQCTDQASFLEKFRYFCTENVPRNAKLRSDMILCIQSSAIKATALWPFSWYEHETIVPTLSRPWAEKSSEALRDGRITSIKIKNVDESSLRLLRPDTMINDEIVEGYLELIRKLGAIISTTRLLENRNPGSKYHPTDRGIDIDSLKRFGPVFIPIHHSEASHWTFARLVLKGDSDTMIVEHYDSFGRTSTVMLEAWLQGHFPGIAAEMIHARSPKQRNFTDCGLFMLMGIRLLASGSQHLSQQDSDNVMPTFRERVLAEILAGALDPSSSEYTQFAINDEIAANNPEHDAPPTTYQGIGDNTDPIYIDSPQSAQQETDAKVDPEDHVLDMFSKENTPKERSTPKENIPKESFLDRAITKPTEDRSCSSALNTSCETNHLIKLASIDPQASCPVALELMSVNDAFVSPNHTSPKKKKRPINWPLEAIESFARQQSMVDMLRSAVMASRTREASESKTECLASLWNGVACEANPQHILMIRHDRERFSRAFFQELKALGWLGDRISPSLRVAMQAKLNCQNDQITWKAAQAQATRSKVWTELVDCAAPFLNSSAVILCASSYSTTDLESTTRGQRQAFIQGIQARLQNPQDPIISNLKAASKLYRAITENSLPNHKLRIELRIDLDLADFTNTVSLARAPARLLLPA